MTMQHKISGKKIDYRPMLESDLSCSERDLAYARSSKTSRIARNTATKLNAASKKLMERKPNMARWHCLRVETGKEFAVEKLLDEAGVEVFMPRETDTRVFKGRKIEVTKPYFPSYMLVRFVPSDEAFHALKGVKHVVGFVGGNSGYHIVQAGDVERFRALTEDAQIPRLTCNKTITDGSRAAIVDGPFAGFDCIVLSVKWSRQARGRVAIDIDGRSFEIDSMPIAFLKKL